MRKGLDSLIREEDWWAIWFGFAIIAATLTGLLDRVPRIGKWSNNPLTAFHVITDGVVTGYIFIPLLVLLVGLAASQ